MDNKFEKLKELYEDIYQYTLNISISIKEENIEQIETLLTQRGLAIKKADKVIVNTNFSEEEKKEINNFVKKIRLIEDKNQKEMKEKQENIKEELSKTNFSQKLMTAYKYNKESEPRLIDSTE